MRTAGCAGCEAGRGNKHNVQCNRQWAEKQLMEQTAAEAAARRAAPQGDPILQESPELKSRGAEKRPAQGEWSPHGTVPPDRGSQANAAQYREGSAGARRQETELGQFPEQFNQEQSNEPVEEDTAILDDTQREER